MPLVFFAMLISVLAGRALASQWPHLPAGQGFLVVFASVMLGGGIAKILMAYAAVIYQESRNLRKSFATATQLRQSMLWIWTITTPLLFAGTGWGATVRELTSNSDSLTLQTLLWAMPTFGFLFLVEMAYFHWEEYCRSGSSQSDLERSFSIRFVSFFWNQAKHSWLIVAIPAIALCCLLDAISFFQTQTGVTIPSWVAYGVVLTLMMASMPDVMAKLWNAKPLDRDTKSDRIFRFWRLIGGNPRALRFWSTQMRAINAVVIGVFPWRRKVLLSDLLLERLDSQQIEMILAHEAAHIRRNHFLFRSIPWASMLLVAFLLRIVSGDVSINRFSEASQIAASEFQWIASLASLVPILLVILFSCLVSRWTEYDADRVAVEIALNARKEMGEDCSAEEAIDQLCSSLKLTTLPANHRKRTWMHPSIEDRIKALNARLLDRVERGTAIHYESVLQSLPTDQQSEAHLIPTGQA